LIAASRPDCRPLHDWASSSQVRSGAAKFSPASPRPFFVGRARSSAAQFEMSRIFLLSPAKTSGKRAAMALSQSAQFHLAKQLRSETGVAIGEAFSFFSSLYFRGKLLYARHFGRASSQTESCYVITSAAGLISPDFPVTADVLGNYSQIPIDPSEPRYREPLLRSAHELNSKLERSSSVVLLGSIATGKYVDILTECFGSRLLFPADFIGRGDMSRGGLLLRAVAASKELDYLAFAETTLRTGKRVPKL